jgi:hypothetical protein
LDDLRLSKIREQQAALGSEYGLDGFYYYHYWFGNGKELLHEPIEMKLKIPKEDLPFCWVGFTKTGPDDGME